MVSECERAVREVSGNGLTYSLGFFFGPGFPLGLGSPSAVKERPLFEPGFGPGIPFLLGAASVGFACLFPDEGVSALGAGVALLDSDGASSRLCSTVGFDGVDRGEFEVVDFEREFFFTAGAFGSKRASSDEVSWSLIIFDLDGFPVDLADEAGAETVLLGVDMAMVGRVNWVWGSCESPVEWNDRRGERWSYGGRGGRDPASVFVRRLFRSSENGHKGQFADVGEMKLRVGGKGSCRGEGGGRVKGRVSVGIVKVFQMSSGFGVVFLTKGWSPSVCARALPLQLGMAGS